MKHFKGILSGNQLKLLALVSMTCDHAGKQLMPDAVWLTAIGRLAFPVFAYMIAEGCRYTGNKARYVSAMAGLAAVCQIVFYIAEKSLYQCVLVTFTLSILLIYAFDNAMRKRTLSSFGIVASGFLITYFLAEILPLLLKETGYCIDYGFWGVCLPVLVFMANRRWQKILAVSIALIIIALTSGGVQWFSLLSLPLIALYNGKKGKYNIKNLFYVYYPAHLAVIYLISTIIGAVAK